jgi:hypothetical protein
MCQAQPGLPLGGIGKPEIREHISGPTSNRLFPFSALACHGVPRNRTARVSPFWDILASMLI